MITKNAVVEIQIHVVNHESRPVKSNLDSIRITDFTGQRQPLAGVLLKTRPEIFCTLCETL